jgi:hypothetical protein
MILQGTQIAMPPVIAATESTDAGQARGIDKSILTLAAPAAELVRLLHYSFIVAAGSRLNPG